MSLIHHYTSINTLSLILKYKTIRFNRLDRVDDMSEAESYGDYEMGKFLFVSCWTDSSIESIPLWHMYTNGMRGVRISIDSDWMHYRELEPDPKYNFIQSGKILAPIPFDKFFNDEYFILPNIFQREKLLRKVEYVDDPSIYFKKAIHIEKKENDQAEMKLGVNDFAIFKKKVWSFQEEVRFILFMALLPIEWVVFET